MNIDIKHLRKTYQGKLILDLNNIQFIENKTYCIKGRNGTGKTTLLKIIANLLTYDTGLVLYNGNSMIKDLMTKLTYVSPNPYIFDATVFNNISYPLHLRKMDQEKIELLVNDYINYFELNDIKNENARKCSSGEKMKIALCRSLIFQPKLLLLDEPTTNLDVESIEKLCLKLKELKKSTTIIFISHDVHFINEICDEIFILKDTKLELGD